MNRLAIIGLGPRGLYALENVLIELQTTTKEIEISIFESSENLGAGNVWSTNQPDSNWINITERALSGLKERPKITHKDFTIDAFPSYHDWCEFSLKPTQADTFPSRNKLGTYLNERFNSIQKEFKDLSTLSIIKSEVLNIDLDEEEIVIKTTVQDYYCDSLLLTIGHQPTELSDQLKNWKEHVKNHSQLHVFEEPYPVTQLSKLKHSNHISVGIRGFGLAMIDVMRYLAINDYGNFKIVDNCTFETVYYKTKPQNLKLIPFSLDGLPLAPKPLNENIDSWYKPTPKEFSSFETELVSAAKNEKQVNSIDFLTHPIAKIASRVFIDLNKREVKNSLEAEDIETIILKWLDDAKYTHNLIQDNSISTYTLIQKYVDMALGEIPISLDFCVGQVWRHCQPILYQSLSHAKLDDEIIAEVIALDERSKRYSYGPPIESMQQILALVDADILNLDYVNDPKIELVDNGWQLKNKEHKLAICNVMVNSVLDAPKILEVKSSIIKKLLQNKLIKPVHTELGIETKPNGYVKTPKNHREIPIAVLGRLAKGSVIGVDAILECFGERIENWAKYYVKSLK